MKPYTYLIKFKPTGQYYYGSRFKNVRLGINPEDDLMIKYPTSSKYIKDLIAEYGLDAFEWEVRRTFDTPEQAADWETRVLKRCKVLESKKWLNGNIAGYIVPTEETRKKIRDFHKGKAKSEEHKKNLSESQKGKPKKYVQTEEHRRKNSLANSGKNNPMYGPCSPERAANISAAKKGKPAHNKGVPMSEEQKAKIRATKAANPTKMSAETIAKRSAKIKGQKRSNETKLRMSLAAKGKPKGPMSEEEKLKRSLALKGKPKQKGHGSRISATVAAQKAAGTHYSQIKLTCPHCGTQASKARYNGYHGDKCKRKAS